MRTLAGMRILDCLTSVVGPLRPERWRDEGAIVSRVRLTFGEAATAWLMPVLDYEEPKIFDMSCSSARDAFYDLVKGSDVIVQNYRPYHAIRLAADAPTLRVVNPDLLYLTAYRR